MRFLLASFIVTAHRRENEKISSSQKGKTALKRLARQICRMEAREDFRETGLQIRNVHEKGKQGVFLDLAGCDFLRL